jgi:predicted Holliday junction resolvase-like endonuclease
LRAALIGLAVGFALGVVSLIALRRRIEERQARYRFERWTAADRRRAVRYGVDRGRAGIKDQLGVDLAPQLTAFPFEASDIRFLGHPSHFVVFDGHTDVKDRRSEEFAEVVFVTVRPDPATPSASDEMADADLLDECLRAGRVRWSTLRPSTMS